MKPFRSNRRARSHSRIYSVLFRARPTTTLRLAETASSSPATNELPPYEWPAILDHSTKAAFVHDGDLRILRCNAVYAARAGLPISEIIGMPYWQVFPKFSERPPPCKIDRPVEGVGAPTVTSHDGHILVAETTAAPCPAGNFWYCRHTLEDVTIQKTLERELAREKAVLDAIIETVPNTFFLVDQDAKLVRWNTYLKQRTGLSDEQLRGYSALSLVHKDDRSLVSAKLLTTLAIGSAQLEVRIARQAGEFSYFLTNTRRVMIDDVPYVAGLCMDITDRKRAEQALEEQKKFLDALVENIPGVFCVLDAEGNYLRWNTNLNKLTGLSDEELYKRSSLLSVTEEDRREAAERLQEGFERGYVKAVLHIDAKDRGTRAFLTTGRRFEVQGTPYMIGVGVDTTDEMAALNTLEHEARTDSLTRVANRGYFMGRAADEFARCRRYGHPLSLWILDLDFFKDVNDSHGHQAGDAVLQAFVRTCQQALRDWDFLGRMGGEEFAVLLPETDTSQALLVAERLRQAVAHAKVEIGDASVAVTVSIGVATVCENDQDVHALMARADAALYEAKNTGRNKVCTATRQPAKLQ